MGVVSGVGGGGSGAWFSVAWVAWGFREQPGAAAEASRQTRIHRARIFMNSNGDDSRQILSSFASRP